MLGGWALIVLLAHERAYTVSLWPWLASLLPLLSAWWLRRVVSVKHHKQRDAVRPAWQSNPRGSALRRGRGSGGTRTTLQDSVAGYASRSSFGPALGPEAAQHALEAAPFCLPVRTFGLGLGLVAWAPFSRLYPSEALPMLSVILGAALLAAALFPPPRTRTLRIGLWAGLAGMGSLVALALPAWPLEQLLGSRPLLLTQRTSDVLACVLMAAGGLQTWWALQQRRKLAERGAHGRSRVPAAASTLLALGASATGFISLLSPPLNQRLASLAWSLPFALLALCGTLLLSTRAAHATRYAVLSETTSEQLLRWLLRAVPVVVPGVVVVLALRFLPFTGDRLAFTQAWAPAARANPSTALTLGLAWLTTGLALAVLWDRSPRNPLGLARRRRGRGVRALARDLIPLHEAESALQAIGQRLAGSGRENCRLLLTCGPQLLSESSEGWVVREQAPAWAQPFLHSLGPGSWLEASALSAEGPERGTNGSALAAESRGEPGAQRQLSSESGLRIAPDIDASSSTDPSRNAPLQSSLGAFSGPLARSAPEASIGAFTRSTGPSARGEKWSEAVHAWGPDVLSRTLLEVANLKQPHLKELTQMLQRAEVDACATFFAEDRLAALLLLPSDPLPYPRTASESRHLARMHEHLTRIVAAETDRFGRQQLNQRLALEGACLRERLAGRDRELRAALVERDHLRLGAGLGHAEPGVSLSASMRRFESDLAAAGRTRLPLRIEVGTGYDREALLRQLKTCLLRRGDPCVIGDLKHVATADSEALLLGSAYAGLERRGWLELAAGGLCVLFDLPALPLEGQTRLAQTFAENLIRPLGTLAAIEPLRARVVVVVEGTLEEHLAQGTLAEELAPWFDLGLSLPTLAERRADLPLLALSYIASACRKRGLPPKGLARGAEQQLLRHAWPGNERELELVLDLAVARAGQRIEAKDLRIAPIALPAANRGPEEAQSAATSAPKRSAPARRASTGKAGNTESGRSQRAPATKPPKPNTGNVSEAATVRDERAALLRALSEAKGNKSAAARALGLTRAALQGQIKRHGISLDAQNQAHPSTRPANRRRSTP